ncbi:MAG: DUF1624 domain-containing protein [Dehalococcoidales bacterium]|nr:DUF1624 domain-containing protein [Dehalococcoidales bacterium]
MEATDNFTGRAKRWLAKLGNTLVVVSPVENRVKSLDLLRGLAIVLMIIVNALAAYEATPSWLGHTPGVGYTIADVVAPMFLFSIGISYELSFSRRLASQGKRQTIRHFMIRYLILFCFGFFGELLVLKRVSWDVLSVIGTVGIYSLPFMFLRPRLRLAVALIPFVAYQLALSLGARTPLIDMGMGHPVSTPAWGFIVISASVLGNQLQRKDFRHMSGVLGRWGAALTLAGILLTLAIPWNKHIVSASYIVFSSGLAALAMLVFHLFSDVLKLRLPLLGAVGRNALALYILSSLLVLGLNAVLPFAAPLSSVVAGLGVVLALSVLTGVMLDRRRLYIRL